MSILAATTDLMFRTQITETARQAGAVAKTAQSASELFEQIRLERPKLIFLDLDSAPLQPVDSLRTLKQSADLEGVAIIAFYQHTHTQLGKYAQEAGCDHVLTRGQMVARLKGLIQEFA